MKSKFWRWALKVSFSKCYPDKRSLKILADEINSETWIGAQSETGGHALSKLKPIGEYEMISLSRVMSNLKSMDDGAVSTKNIDYWEKSWK